MKNLNSKTARNALAKLIEDYSQYTKWHGLAFKKMIKDDNSETEQKLYDAEWFYWGFMEKQTEMKLAQLDIFINGELSKDKFSKYNFDNYDEWKELHSDLQKAMEEHQEDVDSIFQEVA